ncbi:hypothetical protein CVT24_005327 [Panaeolus cyanescens]|uniref:Uncharacterized protein n=1 Tax=Panaeolus cyanescens TaxID=181874 RepID=A0A409Y992_9AGAR|nr:hypothetical protein CVT24_005327 [Panaeolus cyanescens]
MSSSFSSVVSNLVRASMGAAVSPTVPDDDLDRHVAELILREAKKKAERYGEQGVRAYVSNNLSDSNAPRPNKRFLTSIIKSTDEHNKSVLRAQAQAAQEIKREREEQDRRERRARAAEAAEAERLRRSGKSSSSKRRRSPDANDEAWDRWDGRTAPRRKISRNWESWDGEDSEEEEEKRRKRRRSRSRSNERTIARSRSPPRRNRDDDKEEGPSNRRRHDHSKHESSRLRSDRHNKDDSSRRRRKSHERSDKHSRRSRSPSNSTANYDSSRKRRRSLSPDNSLQDKASNKHRKQSPDRIRTKEPSNGNTSSHDSTSAKVTASGSSKSISKLCPSVGSASRSPSPGPEPAIQLPSKMDRYFEESYDPRLDVEPLSAPQVPSSGLINNAEFEGWDAMLELIRVRRADKEEKKRLERLGLLPKDKGKGSKKKSSATTTTSVAPDKWGAEVSVMDIEYAKRGSVREWDVGKEGF